MLRFSPMDTLSLTEEVEVARAILGDDAKAVEAAQAVVDGSFEIATGDPDVETYLDVVAVGGQGVAKKFKFGADDPGTFDQCVMFQQKERGYGEDRAKRVCGAIQARQEGTKKAKHDRDAKHEAAEARAKKYGIPVIEGGRLSPPKGFPTEESAYGDPVNFGLPLHDKKHADNAAARFVQTRDKYPEPAQKTIYTRVVNAQLEHGSSPDPGKDLLVLLPPALRDKLKKVIVKMDDGVRTDDAAGPFYLKVMGVSTEIVEGTTTYSYRLAGLVGAKENGVAWVRSAQEFAIGDVVEVVGGHPQVSVYMDHIMVMGKTDQPVTDILVLLSESHDVDKSVVPIGDPTTVAGWVLTGTDNHITVALDVGTVVQKHAPFRRFMPFAKRTITDAKQEIGGVFYPANRLDAHNEYANPEDLRKAAHLWLSESRVFNVEHTDVELSGVKPVESFLAKTDIPEWDAHPDDWVGVVKVQDADVWSDIENGVYKGFSIEGVCDKVSEGTKKRMANLLVTRVSLVREPATLMEFTAKNRGAKAPEDKMSETKPIDLDPVNKALDRLQTLSTDILDALGAKRPNRPVTFKTHASPDEQRVSLMVEQADYIGKALETAHPAIKVAEEALAKAIATAMLQGEVIKSLEEQVHAYEIHPDIAKLLKDLNQEPAKV